MKSFSFWANLICGIWLVSFALVAGGYLFAFFVPISPFYKGLNNSEALNILQSILDNYLPYLGIVFGAYFFSKHNQEWRDHLIYSAYPFGIIILSLIYNIVVLVVLSGSLWDRENDMQTFLTAFRILNTGFAFFVAFLLSHFFATAIEGTPSSPKLYAPDHPSLDIDPNTTNLPSSKRPDEGSSQE